MTANHLAVIPVDTVPPITPGDDLAVILLDALERTGGSLADGDIVTITS